MKCEPHITCTLDAHHMHITCTSHAHHMYMHIMTDCSPCTYVDCAHGFPSSDAINITKLYFASVRSRLYVLPSMNFSCDGSITDIRMKMYCIEESHKGQSQEVVVYFLLFHNGLNSPTRRVTHILLNQTNTRQELPNEIWTNSDPLSLPVTEGSYIGFAIPESSPNSENVFKNVNFSPTPERVEVQLHSIIATANFNEFEGKVLEAARTADSSQFTTQMIPLPLIDVSFSKWLSAHACAYTLYSTHNINIPCAYVYKFMYHVLSSPLSHISP